jgi:2-iminobutanoate/2-iminopropanoate deaminase
MAGGALEIEPQGSTTSCVTQEEQMPVRTISASEGPPASGGYAQAVEVRGAERMLYMSGQIPMARDGSVPDDFEGQCRLVWSNIEAQLRAADMTLAHVVKVTTYLSDRRFAEENSAIRRDVLGSLSPALTVVIAGIYDEGWLLEIEVIAAA